MAAPRYLQPYLTAAQRHGGNFSSLLWASRQTQRVRFEALARWLPIAGRTLLDAGCGRADLLDYLIERKIVPARYIGLEAVEPLAEAAEEKTGARTPGKASNATVILRGDFVNQPEMLQQSAEVIVFSGSLNTLKKAEFEATLRAAWEAATVAVGFNFLSSPYLAAAPHLTWHHAQDVVDLLSGWAQDVTLDDSYLKGDCTIVMHRR